MDRPEGSRTDGWVAFGAGLVTLVLLVSWIPPGLTGKDAGDFTTAVAVLGIPHPTGYPLYCLLGKAFSLLVPWGDLAHRLNLFSAVTVAAAVAVLHLALVRLPLPSAWDPGSRPRTSVALATALLVGFAPTIASQAIIPEVYPLLFLQAALLLFLCGSWAARPKRRILVAAAFAAGLGLTNHMTFGLLLPAALAYLAASRWTELRDELGPKKLMRLALALGAGLLPYAYLPLRSLSQPPLDWAGATTIDAFWRHVTGGAYQDKWGGLEAASLQQHIGFLRANFPGPLPLLMLLGVVLLAYRGRSLLVLLAGGVLAVGWFAVGYHVLDTEYMQTAAMPSLAGLFFVGASFLARFLPHRGRALLAGLLVVAPVASVTMHAARLDRSNDDRTYRRIHRLMAQLPEDALVITHGDFPIIPAWYLQQVEEVKSGVGFLHDSLPFRYPAFLAGLRRQRPDLMLPETSVEPERGLSFLLLVMEANVDRVPLYATAIHASFHQRFILQEIPVMAGSRLWRVHRRPS